MSTRRRGCATVRAPARRLRSSCAWPRSGHLQQQRRSSCTCRPAARQRRPSPVRRITRHPHRLGRTGSPPAPARQPGQLVHCGASSCAPARARLLVRITSTTARHLATWPPGHGRKHARAAAHQLASSPPARPAAPAGWPPAQGLEITASAPSPLLGSLLAACLVRVRRTPVLARIWFPKSVSVLPRPSRISSRSEPRGRGTQRPPRGRANR